jgi:hypothetical protein
MKAKIIFPAKAIVAVGISAFSIFTALNQSAKAAGQDTVRSGSVSMVSDTKEKSEGESASRITKTSEQERLFRKLDSLRADYTERVRMRGRDGKPLVDSDGKPVMPVPGRHFVYHVYDLNPAAGLSGLLPGDFIFVTNKDGTIQVVAREYQIPDFPLGAVWLMIMRGEYAAAEKTLEFLESYIKTLKQ